MTIKIHGRKYYIEDASCVELTTICEGAYEQGLKDAYELNDDRNEFINEIIRLCKDDGNDDVLKEVLCRKLFKYGFIKFVNGSYILQECEYRKEEKNG